MEKEYRYWNPMLGPTDAEIGVFGGPEVVIGTLGDPSFGLEVVTDAFGGPVFGGPQVEIGAFGIPEVVVGVLNSLR